MCTFAWSVSKHSPLENCNTPCFEQFSSIRALSQRLLVVNLPTCCCAVYAVPTLVFRLDLDFHRLGLLLVSGAFGNKALSRRRLDEVPQNTHMLLILIVFRNERRDTLLFRGSYLNHTLNILLISVVAYLHVEKKWVDYFRFLALYDMSRARGRWGRGEKRSLPCASRRPAKIFLSPTS